MKKSILLLLIPFKIFGQLQIDFNDNSLSQWFGDTSHYQIDSLQQLQLFGLNQSSTSTIYHPSRAILNGKWQFDVSMDFNPFSSNYCQIFLCMDEDLNSYFVRLGGSDDEVSLFKSSNNQNSEIIDGTNDLLDLDSVKITVKVERDSIGNWHLWTKSKDSQWSLQGSSFENSFNMSQSFAISCTYTTTRSQEFFFDNISISGTSFIDTFDVPKVNDIIINEILFNPIDGDNDFVEIYNRSNKTLNIQNLSLGNYYGGRPDNFKVIKSNFHLIEPSEIIVLSSSLENLIFYHPDAVVDKVIELENMPSYNNDEGTVVLTLDTTIIDEFNYFESLHFPYLNSVDGVSLERIDSEVESNRHDNWHSASEQNGFSSPTLKNSQKKQLTNELEVLELNPKIISPDNDGQNDFLQIDLKFEKSGYNATILIFDSQGILINSLVSSVFLGAESTFYWNGLNQNEQVVQKGRYILLLEAIHPQAASIVQKKTVVIDY